MSDFIREVDEEYRRDRFVAFLLTYRYALIALAVLIVLGTAGYRVYLSERNKAAEAADARYAAAAQLVRDGKIAEGQAAFDKIESDGPSGYAALARMSAVEALAKRDPAAAARGFDAIALDDGVEQSLRDAAQLRGAMIRVDIDDPKAFEKRYGPIATPTYPFRNSLRELLALAAFKASDMDAAGRWLDQIIVDDQTPTALRKRAQAFLGLVAAGPVRIGTPEAPKPVVREPSTTPQAEPAAAPATPAQTPSAASPAVPLAPAPAASAPPLATPAAPVSPVTAPADPTPPASVPAAPAPAAVPPAH